jgi:hypothetical protein
LLISRAKLRQRKIIAELIAGLVLVFVHRNQNVENQFVKAVKNFPVAVSKSAEAFGLELGQDLISLKTICLVPAHL